MNKTYLYKCVDPKTGNAITGFKDKSEAENALRMLKDGFVVIAYVASEYELNYKV